MFKVPFSGTVLYLFAIVPALAQERVDAEYYRRIGHDFLGPAIEIGIFAAIAIGAWKLISAKTRKK